MFVCNSCSEVDQLVLSHTIYHSYSGVQMNNDDDEDTRVNNAIICVA